MWLKLTGWSVCQPWPGHRPLFTTLSQPATSVDKKKFLLLSWSISGCNPADTSCKHFWKLCWNCFQMNFTENNMKRKRISGEMPKQWWNRVPVEIQIWVQHSGVFCFQNIFYILPVLFSVAHGGKNDVSENHCPWSVAENTQTFFQNTTIFLIYFFNCIFICVSV